MRVNMENTKIMMSGGINLDLLKKSGKDPCGVCQTGAGSNSNFCGDCLCWFNKKCGGIKGPLCPDPDFRCARCLGMAWPIDGRTVKEVKVEDEKLEPVPHFCYLWDMLSAGGGSSCKCGPVLPTASSSHQHQPAASNPRSGIFNMLNVKCSCT